MFEYKETTVGDIINEMNRWLDFKRKNADNWDENPTMSELHAYFMKTVSNWVDYAGRSVLDGYRMRCEEEGIHPGRQDIWAHTLLDFRGAKTDGSSFMEIVTYLPTKTSGEKPEAETLLVLPIIFKEVQDGDVSRTVIQKMDSSVDPGTLLKEIVERAASLQLGAGLDLNARWLCAPESFRIKHPICPACGAPVRLGSSEEDAMRHVFCDSCDWESHKRVYYLDDYICAKSFLSEVKFLNRARDVSEKITGALEAMDKALISIEGWDKDSRPYVMEAKSATLFKRKLKEYSDRFVKLQSLQKKV